MKGLNSMLSRVLETPPAARAEAQQHFFKKLTCGTDPSDVHEDMGNKVNAFLFVDVRSAESYRQAHAHGAVNIPQTEMTPERMAAYSKDQVFVVYCWGPGCNGATKAALKLSRLGFAVKEMIGGIEYWEKEGYLLDRG